MIHTERVPTKMRKVQTPYKESTHRYLPSEGMVIANDVAIACGDSMSCSGFDKRNQVSQKTNSKHVTENT